MSKRQEGMVGKILIGRDFLTRHITYEVPIPKAIHPNIYYGEIYQAIHAE